LATRSDGVEASGDVQVDILRRDEQLGISAGERLDAFSSAQCIPNILQEE